MSGHSHARTVRHQKEASALQRGATFSKMIKILTIAVKESGPNPETNTKLKMAIERAKGFNMPKDNIERAIKNAAGGADVQNLEEVSFEAYGPGGIAVIIEGVTDNKNRTLNLIKQALNQGGGKLAQEGSVRWMFDRKGIIIVDTNLQTDPSKNKESIEMTAIESGAEDIRQSDNILEIYTKPEEVQIIKSTLETKGIKIESGNIEWIAKDEITLEGSDKESAQRLFDSLSDNEDVQDTYSNLKE